MGSFTQGSTGSEGPDCDENSTAGVWPHGSPHSDQHSGPVGHGLGPQDKLDLRSVLLAKAVQYEIIPRLMLAHRSTESCSEQLGQALAHVSPQDVHRFARVILEEDDVVVRQHVQALRQRGVPVETLFLELLAPAARYLGELWEQDLCSFTDVTVGLGRLQQVLRDNSAHLPEVTTTSSHNGRPYRVLLLPCPGEQHTFGLFLVAEFFHRAGWEVHSEFLPRNGAPQALVQDSWYDVVGFSLGNPKYFSELSDCIEQIRHKSINSDISIICGGAAFSLNTELALNCPADAVITDGSLAPETARDLLARHGTRAATNARH